MPEPLATTVSSCLLRALGEVDLMHAELVELIRETDGGVETVSSLAKLEGIANRLRTRGATAADWADSAWTRSNEDALERFGRRGTDG